MTRPPTRPPAPAATPTRAKPLDASRLPTEPPPQAAHSRAYSRLLVAVHHEAARRGLDFSVAMVSLLAAQLARWDVPLAHDPELCDLCSTALSLSDPSLGSSRSPAPSWLRYARQVEPIVHAVADELEIDPAELSTLGRHPRVVLARALVVHLARQLTTKSYPEIGRVLNRERHSIAVMAHQRIKEQIDSGQIVQVGCRHDGIPITSLIDILMRRLDRDPDREAHA